MRRRRSNANNDPGGRTELPRWITMLSRFAGRLAELTRKKPVSATSNLTCSVLQVFSRDGNRYVDFIRMGQNGYRFDIHERVVDPDGRGHYWAMAEGAT